MRHPASLKRDPAAQAAFAALDLDAAVVAAYGLILPPAMLDAPRRGCLNIHASLLPRWRGAAPIQAALLAGDAETGVTIMQMDAGLDTGATLLTGEVPIGPHTTATELQGALATLGAQLVLRALAEAPSPKPQPAEGSSYAPKLSRADAALDWSRPAAELERRVRALNPWPGAACHLRGETLKVLEADAVGRSRRTRDRAGRADDRLRHRGAPPGPRAAPGTRPGDRGCVPARHARSGRHRARPWVRSETSRC